MMPTDPKYLTDRFTEEELGVHEFPAELSGIDRERVRNCARILAMEVLEPAVAWLGEPLIVTSGYRPPEHNRAVGGKQTSFHLYNLGHAAADVKPRSKPVVDLFDWLRNESGIGFDKVILELAPGNWVNALLETVAKRLSDGEELKPVLAAYPGLKPLVVHCQLDVNAAPRRLAYVGCTGDAQKYLPVEVRKGADHAA
jgi:zinc D-Ala-D-Ala carboxypeptidase